MDTTYAIQIILTSIALVYSCYTDVKYRLIKNFITFPLMAIGTMLNIINHGLLEGLKTSFIGMVLVFAICILFSMMGGFGFGDTKLLMGIGSMFGGWFVIDVLTLALITMVLYFVIFKFKDFKKLFHNLHNMSFSTLYMKKVPQIEKQDSAWTVPYACFITCSFYISLIISFILGGNLVWTILS